MSSGRFALPRQMLAGPATFASLSEMSEEDWARTREASQAATAKAERSV
ncbi:hypothetical protein [Brevibacterium ammoniilyticum]